NGVSPEDTEEMKTTLSPYLIVMVTKGLSLHDSARFKSREYLQRNIIVRDSKNNTLEIVSREDWPDLASEMEAILLPWMENSLGEMGKSIQFILYKNSDEDGNPLISATKTGELTIDVGDQIERYILPLNSLLLPLICKDCGRELSARYNYCPFDATPLKEIQGEASSHAD